MFHKKSTNSIYILSLFENVCRKIKNKYKYLVCKYKIKPYIKNENDINLKNFIKYNGKLNDIQNVYVSHILDSTYIRVMFYKPIFFSYYKKKYYVNVYFKNLIGYSINSKNCVKKNYALFSIDILEELLLNKIIKLTECIYDISGNIKANIYLDKILLNHYLINKVMSLYLDTGIKYYTLWEYREDKVISIISCI